MEEPCIRVEKLTKSFAGRTVVDDLSFSVRKGEVYALLGHNGAGKSTTIDLILRLKSPDTSLLYFPMLLFSGATIPVEVFPKWFQMIAKLMPLGIGIDLLKSVSLGCYDNIAVPVITLIAITAICGTIAVKTFRWE